jgi:hypothetical protein
MKKLAIALLACALAGCVAAPVVPPLGIVYTDVRAPLVPAGNVGSKRGTSTVTSICGVFAWGDGGIRKAAANGNIQEVKLVDYEFKNVLGVYQRYTTVAYGD